MVLHNEQVTFVPCEIAPLRISQDRSRKTSLEERSSQESQPKFPSVETGKFRSQAQMTPPTTPYGSQEDLHNPIEKSQQQHQLVFHNFLRAFYPFSPTYAPSEKTITVPLREGDIILIHSIHTNGWADGTILTTGSRGWLPTNYCEAYDPEPMRNLLSGLLNFWDQLRCGISNKVENFSNQEFVGGMIAGVRYLLEKTMCLNRESLLIRDCQQLRLNRTNLLDDLNALVKTAKTIQEYVALTNPSSEQLSDMNTIIDGIMLKAFNVVNIGVQFFDLWKKEIRSLPYLLRIPSQSGLTTYLPRESATPPSPPADSNHFEFINNQNLPYQEIKTSNHNKMNEHDMGSWTSNFSESLSKETSLYGHTANFMYPSSLNMKSNPQSHSPSSSLSSSSSSSSSSLSSSSPPISSSTSIKLRRQTTSHRISPSIPTAVTTNTKATTTNSTTKPFQPQSFVSEKLNCSHDTLLSFLGSFIGRLHLQSQSSADLISAVQQFVSAGRELLTVVGIICDHDVQSARCLSYTKNTMEDRIQQLVKDAQEIIQSSGDDEESVVLPDQKACLLMASTGCVKAAGECVAKTKFVLERIGDFQIPSSLKTSDENDEIISILNKEKCRKTLNKGSINAPEPTKILPPHSLPFVTPNYEKPLPEVPLRSSSLSDDETCMSPRTSFFPSSISHEENDVMVGEVDTQPLLSNIEDNITSNLCIKTEKIVNENETDQENEVGINRSSNINMVKSSSEGNFFHRKSLRRTKGSESSILFQNSSNTKVPDQTSVSLNSDSTTRTDLQSQSSKSSLQIDKEDSESHELLEKTFAHEIILNKDGAIIGASLPALVERLTAHESTPDSLFVSTFYLTFRLFATPEEFARALIERFDYIGENPKIAVNVRLRVYNVIKGWLESHWRDSTDRSALKMIEDFATEKLSSVIPGAGQRLSELVAKVSSTEFPLVPRIVSMIGRKPSATVHYVPADTPLPPSILSRSSSQILRTWKSGSGSSPTIVDFDPLEVARQLTLKGMSIFCAIVPEELLDSEWTKRSESIATNVRAMASLSTDLSNLVADTVLQHEDIKKRANVIKHWIKIAQKCYELNNYDSLMAIICTMNSSTISRLRKTWEAVSQRRKDALKSLQAIVEPDKNYAVLRRRISDHVPPCLPFLGIFLTDLTFLDAGNSPTRQLNRVGESHGLTVINYDKYTRTAKIISELQRFQMPYRLSEVPEIQDWINSEIDRVKLSSENEHVQNLYRKSLLLEPREPHNPSRSPTDGSFSASKEKFDIFGWAHRERSNSLISPNSSFSS